MNKFLFILSMALALLSGCKKETSLPESIRITEYQPKYMLYPVTLLYNKDKLIKIEYNTNGTISKRIGGYISMNPASGYSSMFYDKIYDEVVTQNDIITITKKLSSYEDFSSTTPQIRILFFKDGRLVKKISDESHSKDTIAYQYNEKGQIYYMETQNLYLSNKIETNLVYDESRNLTMVTSKRYYSYDQSLIYSDTTRFSDYDHSKNPFANLIIFDECFYRALSSNNFTKYSYRKYDPTGRLIGSQDRGWEFKYDANNNLLYSNL